MATYMVYGIWVTHVGSWDVCTYIFYPFETAIVIVRIFIHTEW